MQSKYISYYLLLNITVLKPKNKIAWIYEVCLFLDCLGSSISSTKKDIDTRLTKACTAIDNSHMEVRPDW